MARGVSKTFLRALIGLPLVSVVLTPALAAPILGQDQEDQTTAAPVTPAIQPAVANVQKTVIEFTILPSAADPNTLETTIFVRRSGGRLICANLGTQEIIARAYEPKEEPFSPEIPSQLRGRQTNHVGQLLGFNTNNVFIKPNSRADKFDNPTEPFTVGDFEAVFIRGDDQCDQELTEDEVIIVGEFIRTGGSVVGGFNDLTRQLRVTLAVNSVAIISFAPGAPPPTTGDFVPGIVGGGIAPPSGAIGAAPVSSDSFAVGGEGGGGGLPIIPNVIGLPLGNAISLITSSGFIVGTITARPADNASLLDGLFITTAYAFTIPPELSIFDLVISQSQAGEQPFGTVVDFGVQAQNIPVPEPSTASIFIVGLLLVGGWYWYSRTRARPVLRRTKKR